MSSLYCVSNNIPYNGIFVNYKKPHIAGSTDYILIEYRLEYVSYRLGYDMFKNFIVRKLKD